MSETWDQIRASAVTSETRARLSLSLSRQLSAQQETPNRSPLIAFSSTTAAEACMLPICSACVSDSLFCTAQDPDVLLHVLSGHGSQGQQQQQQSLACVQQQQCCHCGCRGWIGWYQCMHALWVGVFCMRQNQAVFSHCWPCWGDCRWVCTACCAM